MHNPPMGAVPPGADPIQQTDAWAQARAAAGSGTQPAAAGAQANMPMMPPFQGPPGMAGAGGGSAPHRFSVINRDWGNNKTLDLVTQPEAFVTWRDRALGHLAKGRPDIRRLLTWAEKQVVPIDMLAEDAGALEVGMTENDAFQFIQKTAMSERSRMRDVADQILDGSLRPDAG